MGGFRELEHSVCGFGTAPCCRSRAIRGNIEIDVLIAVT